MDYIEELVKYFKLIVNKTAFIVGLPCEWALIHLSCPSEAWPMVRSLRDSGYCMSAPVQRPPRVVASSETWALLPSWQWVSGA
jgi:hypothetical protein